jgi:hypothetical protein
MLAIEWLDAEMSDMIAFLRDFVSQGSQKSLTREEWRAQFFGWEDRTAIEFVHSDAPLDYIFPDSYGSLADVSTWCVSETTAYSDIDFRENVVPFKTKSSDEEPPE